MADVTIEPLSMRTVGLLDELFASDEAADRCWCMWFIKSVKEFHAAGRTGNRESFVELVANESEPVGLIATHDDEAVGWCAVGPKARFTRAVKTPTLRDWRPEDNDTTWFVPCLFVHPHWRDQGVSAALVAGAVTLASEFDATAIEAFPLAGRRRRSGGSDFMTGVEPLFARHGFEPAHRPSKNRVVMRRDT